MADNAALRKAASWVGFFGCVLTFVLGIIHICYTNASVEWPRDVKITSDINSVTWRAPLFTFAPDAFLDNWTPTIMGALGVLMHFTPFEWPVLTKSYGRFFLYHFVTGMVGTIGYRGGLGILFSIPLWLCCLLSIICVFVSDEDASLRLESIIPLRSNK